MKKTIVGLTVGCLLIPGMLNSGIAFAEANENQNSTEESAAAKILTSQTAASAAQETASSSAKEPAASSSENKEASAPAEASAVPETPAFTEEQAKQLQEKLPADTTIQFTEGKLIIELPADIDPSIAQKAYDDLKLNVPVEIRVKVANLDQKSDSYKLGIQVFQEAMIANADNLGAAAEILNGTIPSAIKNSKDYQKAMMGNRFYWGGIFGNSNRYEEYGTDSFKVDANQFQAGIEAARQAYALELEGYLEKINSQAMIYRDKLADSTAYVPNAESSMGGFWGFISGAGTAVGELIKRFFGGGLDKKIPEVWTYDSNSPLTSAGSFQGRKTKKTSEVVKETQKNLINYIGIVLPTVQNILVKRTLKDPRAIGGPEGVFLPETLNEALTLNKGLNTVTKTFGFGDAIKSNIADQIYISMRNAVKTALVESGQKGLNKQIAVQLADEAPLASFKTINDYYTEGESLSLAYDATYTLSQSYITPLKAIAMSNAFINEKDKSQGDLTEGQLFELLARDHADIFTAETMQKFNSDGGKAAREMLYKIYRAEFDGVQKAINDFQANPFEIGTTATFTNPNNNEQVNVQDYIVIWNWLNLASQTLMKNGMHDADLKSHEQKDGKVAEISETPTEQMTLASNEIAAANQAYPNDTDIITEHHDEMMAIAKDSYRYSYNAEAKRANTAFEKGGEEFINQATVKNKEPYSLYGLKGIKDTPDEPLDANYTGTNDQTSSLFKAGDPNYLAGLAFKDGFAKKFETDGLQIVLEVQKDKDSLGEVSELKELFKADSLMRYGVISQKKTTINIPNAAGWELEDPQQKGHSLSGNTIELENQPFETGNYPYENGQKLTHQKKIVLNYNKLLTPSIESFTANGFSVEGTLKRYEGKKQTVQIKDQSGTVIVTAKVDQKGRFEADLPQDKVKVGDTLSATAVLVNTFGTETTSAARQTKITEGTLVFNVTTASGKDNNELLWTKRLLQLGSITLDRDAGNEIEIAVKDHRLVPKDWSLTVGAAGTQNSHFELMWNDQLLIPGTSIHVLEGSGTKEQDFSEKEGLKLHSDKTIPIGKYTSEKGTAPTVEWTLNNVETAD